MFTSALWTLVAMDYMIEVYEGFHYSVDMWLGAVFVNLIWTVLAPIEAAYEESLSDGQQQQQQQHGQKQQRLQSIRNVTLYDTIRYVTPALCAYLQVVHVIPEDITNYTILSFILFAIFQIITEGFHRHTQHVLICLLYVALGVYL